MTNRTYMWSFWTHILQNGYSSRGDHKTFEVMTTA